MEVHEYTTMALFETSYWWYRGLHGAIFDLLDDFDTAQDARMLDAGCGTGGNLLNLARRYTQTSGFDYSRDAIPFWHQRGLSRCAIASINEIPYADNSFAVVMSMDVLETDTVDEARAIAELCRVTQPGGIILITVPAYRWLFSPEHHQAVHASRRYTRRAALRLFDGQPVQIMRASYMFTLLFPLIAARRLFSRFFERTRSGDAPRSELKPLPKAINGLFTAIMRLERRALRRVDLPFGSSIVIIGRKQT